jgi:hypothetical protein
VADGRSALNAEQKRWIICPSSPGISAVFPGGIRVNRLSSGIESVIIRLLPLNLDTPRGDNYISGKFKRRDVWKI